MPGDSGVTVVTKACAFYQYARGGRIKRAAERYWQNSCEMRGEIAKSCLLSEA
jgi:hypothetical protein